MIRPGFRWQERLRLAEVRIHYLQHDAIENLGSIAAWAVAYGHPLSRTLLQELERLPAIDSFDWLFILGGPMNIYEEEAYPWLAAEKAFIGEAIAAGKVVIGLCLGAQLIADVLGGRITRSREPEIGWLPVRWKPAAQSRRLFSFFPQPSFVLEWHYDTFSTLPPEAEVLADSAACAHQGFMYEERVFGFQFHLETTPELLRLLLKEWGSGLRRSGSVQSGGEMLARSDYFAHNQAWMAEFLNRLSEQERSRLK